MTVFFRIICIDWNSVSLSLLQMGRPWQSEGMISWMLDWVNGAARPRMFWWRLRWTVPVRRVEELRRRRFRLVLGGKVVDLGRE